MDSWEAKELDNPLGVFLRARRQQVRPEQQCIVPGGARQVAGLRRDEVAMLAGISTDYYARMEQGRERHPSRKVVDALSAALLLDRASSRFLRELAAGDDDAAVGDPLAAGRLDAVRPLLGSLTVPAILVDRWLNIVAANALGEVLHEGLEHRENYARMVFLSPGAQEFFADWSELARCMVAALRAGAGSAAGSARLERLVGELAVASEVFSTAWAQHDVYEKAVDRKRFRHPLVGALVFNQHVLELPDSDGHQIWAYHPTDDATEEALVRLGSLATLSASTFTTREVRTS
ncbi:helix-turn-helix domain-containing protein [Saccharopolyspora erythraea]|uniref:helix-turn-helix domain-containing protein n=1 Tax=Saccharopolyspora erythraea TaxID=1836 RepID=UPI001BA7A0BF|nr:helix-turn-helix transcriptional regulator [Saccharopolyspora erythraea]QUH02907.1 helix-turn-helix domain-containing protein [Saccharopolyspora erythraea]